MAAEFMRKQEALSSAFRELDTLHIGRLDILALARAVFRTMPHLRPPERRTLIILLHEVSTLNHKP
jgi:hypothetical protein